MVFQSYALYPHMSVSENLSFGLRMAKGDEKLNDHEIKLRVREAAENLNAARYDHEAAIRELRRNTRLTFLGIQSRLRRIDALAEAVRAGENALLAKEESFSAGLTTNIQVLDAQRDLFQAQRDYLKERYDYIRQMLKLEELAGTLDEEDVRRVNTLLANSS